jgi:hypothetical protein
MSGGPDFANADGWRVAAVLLLAAVLVVFGAGACVGWVLRGWA